jgi:hypothetical protein
MAWGLTCGILGFAELIFDREMKATSKTDTDAVLGLQ